MNIEKGTKAMVFQAKKDENRKRTVIADIRTYEGKDQDDKPRYAFCEQDLSVKPTKTRWTLRTRIGSSFSPAL